MRHIPRHILRQSRRPLSLLPALVLLFVLSAAGPAYAEHDAPGAVARVVNALRERMTLLRESYTEWRRSPYEELAEDMQVRQAAMLRQLEVLQSQLDALRTDLTTAERTPGPAGPRGPQGFQGLPGNLQLAGETCPEGQAVNGFDAFGNVLCAVTAAAATGGVGVDCPGTLVSAADLRRCDLRRERLSGRDLSFATLVKADLRGSITETDLEGADLRRADLTGADLLKVKLAHANLTRARLGSVQVERSDLTGAVLRSAELSFARLVDVRMVGADLSDAVLIMSQHHRGDFTRANLTGADLRQAVFQDSTLFLATTSTSLEQARLVNTICPDGVNSSSNGDSCIGHALR